MKNINYPQPSGTYKICINRKAPWRNYETCRLQISVGKPRYEGEKFRALCEWASHRFGHVIYIVSDTLQRHNILYETGCSPAVAWKLSRHAGDAWLARNGAAMSLSRNADIVRWDDLLHHPAFMPLTPMPDLEGALAATIGDFWRRHGHDGNPTPLFTRHSRAFLLEELGVFSFLFDDPAIDIYAGSWFEELMRVQFPLKDYLAVDYTRNKAIAANNNAVGQAGLAAL